eukprot:NP_871710.2 Uncharacterized protein CELE_Y41C4A.17 [Caenorhabditis elegans]
MHADYLGSRSRMSGFLPIIRLLKKMRHAFPQNLQSRLFDYLCCGQFFFRILVLYYFGSLILILRAKRLSMTRTHTYATAVCRVPYDVHI